jgi:hypothetical protein
MTILTGLAALGITPRHRALLAASPAEVARERLLTDRAKYAEEIALKNLPPLPPPHDPLAEIATLMRALTYGEMTELAARIWAVRPDGVITAVNLPAILHRFATGETHGTPARLEEPEKD